MKPVLNNNIKALKVEGFSVMEKKSFLVAHTAEEHFTNLKERVGLQKICTF